MTDPRVEAYARLLVERCLDVQPGWQVLVRSTPLARPLVEEVARAIGRRGAWAVLRVGFALWPVDLAWAEEAPLDLLAELPAIDLRAVETMDARVTITAPENAREGADLSAERHAAIGRARRPFFRRTMAGEIPWVGCQYPVPALAQEAGLSTEAFAELLYGACLLDWDAEGRAMARHAERFDRAEAVRIVASGTDLALSIVGRRAIVDDGRNNMPGGEFFLCPLEDSAEGVIEFAEFPTARQGSLVEGVRLAFRAGRVVEASAARGEEALLAALDTDDGARRLGELGIGCNPRITRFLRNTLFDEKMAGTAHLALGAGYPPAGGVNESAIHWDIVKDLRAGGRIELDGILVQENGAWVG